MKDERASPWHYALLVLVVLMALAMGEAIWEFVTGDLSRFKGRG